MTEKQSEQKFYYLYNFDSGEALQFGEYEGFIAYINTYNSSFTIFKDKKDWLDMADSANKQELEK